MFCSITQPRLTRGRKCKNKKNKRRSFLYTDWCFYYNAYLSEEIEWYIKKTKYILPLRLSTPSKQHFYSLHQPLNQTYKIVGYHGQWRIQCCLQKPTKERHLRRQDIMQTLKSDVSWFLPFLQILPVKNTPLRYSCLATPKLCNTELLEATTLATIHSRSSAHKCFSYHQGHIKLVA